MADLDSKYRPVLEGALEPGEALDGMLIASQQKGMFKGGAAAIGVTNRRLLFCELDRRGTRRARRGRSSLPTSSTPTPATRAAAGRRSRVRSWIARRCG